MHLTIESQHKEKYNLNGFIYTFLYWHVRNSYVRVRNITKVALYELKNSSIIL